MSFWFDIWPASERKLLPFCLMKKMNRSTSRLYLYVLIPNDVYLKRRGIFAGSSWHATEEQINRFGSLHIKSDRARCVTRTSVHRNEGFRSLLRALACVAAERSVQAIDFSSFHSFLHNGCLISKAHHCCSAAVLSIVLTHTPTQNNSCVDVDDFHFCFDSIG